MNVAEAEVQRSAGGRRGKDWREAGKWGKGREAGEMQDCGGGEAGEIGWAWLGGQDTGLSLCFKFLSPRWLL